MAEYDYDDKIVLTDADKFSLLEPGDYDFKVVGCERARSQAGNKMRTITFEVGDPIDRKVTIKDYMPLTDGARWKLVELFEAVGLKKPGEEYEVNWDDLIGKTGRCSVYVDEYNGGKNKSNKIEMYITPKEGLSIEDNEFEGQLD